MKDGPKNTFPWRSIAIPAVAAAFIVVLCVWRITHPRPIAFVEATYGVSRTIAVGQWLHFDESVSGDEGATIALLDGTRIEMRAASQLALEAGGDGIRIRLDSGGIIVNAAQQRSRTLYVKTKDVLVSAIGTVFLVTADPTGSRVAVIQGEAEVKQGADAKKLLPGQQVSSNPSIVLPPVTEEIAWSRNAAAHLALLQQSGKN